ncbi:hypothetical protein [Streptomyces sp. SJL17-4]|uniref:hypothetical protein n=1 Tax=Streptomyces sp. SJL17-4 TaxID=2967224 RepID=UPI0030CB05D5
MNVQPVLDALDIQEDAARAAADNLRTLQAWLRDAETQLEPLARVPSMFFGSSLSDEGSQTSRARRGPVASLATLRMRG